jgi:hypothetical protein
MWALDEMLAAVRNRPRAGRLAAAYRRATEICDADVATNRAIGENGCRVIEEIAAGKTGKTVNILTHCNAGWLATVDWGTALAPIYMAHDKGIPVHVWADETRPRNQGAALTAWELGSHGVSHAILADNAGGHLMQHGLVDMVIVGTIWDDALLRSREMEAADDAVEGRLAEARPGVLEHVDDASVRAGGEDEDALARHVHRHEALVHDELVELPAGAVEGPAVLPSETPFEGRDAWDLAADVRHAVEQQLWLGGVDHARTMRAERLDARHILHGTHRIVAQLYRACAEHVRMRVVGNLAPAVAISNQPESAQHGAGVVPVTV